jgi:hypothetical protein
MGFFSRRKSYGTGNPNASGLGLEGLTAAGFRVTHQDSDQMRRLIQPWQARSFSYYDQIGEIWYASQFYARMMSLLRLYPAKKNAKGEWEETDDPDAVAALERIQDPGGGREGLLSSYGRLMFIAGETYLLCSTDPDTGQEQWEMLSTDELRVQSGIYTRYRAPSMAAEQLYEAADEDFEPLGDQAVVYRLWRRHPRYSMLADSPMKGVLDLCEELLILTRAVRARGRSRLAGSGILAISEDFSHAPLEATPGEDIEEDPFLRDLKNAMMAPIANEGAASQIVPLVIRGSTEAVERGIRHIQVIDPTQLYPETGLRYECVKRIALGVDMPPEILLGMTDANHWCVDEETEILTAGGWRHYNEFDVGDEVLTLNHETGASEWQPVQDIYRAEAQREPMRELRSRTHSSLTTLPHRWPVLCPGSIDENAVVDPIVVTVGGELTEEEAWLLDMAARSQARSRAVREGIPFVREWTTSAELAAKHSIITAAPHAAPEEATYSSDFVRLVAWFWTEGSIGGNVTISQSHTRNPERVVQIRELLGRLYGPASDTLRGSSAPAWREAEQSNESSHGGAITVFRLNQYAAKDLFVVAPKKRVSLDFIRALTFEQLQIFVAVSCAADGWHYSQGRIDIWQKDGDGLDAFELACILAGCAVSRHESGGGVVVHGLETKSVRPVKAAEHARREGIDGATDRIVFYDGIVWCPVTPNHTWFARRNGKVFFTGNTGWLVDDQTWKAHGQPASNQLVNDLTASYFGPEMRASGREDWAEFAIKYDATDVVNHPDRGKDALDAYQSRAIGKAALRKAKGFDDVDAPSDDELNEMIGVAVRDGSLALYGIPSIKSGGIEPQGGEIVSATGTEGASQGPAVGAEVEPGPPAGKSAAEEPISSVVGSALEAARVVGAADLALRRCRELAGSRLRSLAKRDRDSEKLIDGVPNQIVAARLGPERTRALGTSERELIAGARGVLEETLSSWNLRADQVAVLLEQVERHAARTLYDESPAPLPPQFATYVSGVLARKE